MERVLNFESTLCLSVFQVHRIYMSAAISHNIISYQVSLRLVPELGGPLTHFLFFQR